MKNAAGALKQLYLGAWLERPPAEWRRLVPDPGDAKESVSAEQGLAHLLPEVGVLLLEAHPPTPPPTRKQTQRRMKESETR